jgi:hypothetical protein
MGFTPFNPSCGLKFRDCPEVTKRASTRDQVTMPPVRG